MTTQHILFTIVVPTLGLLVGVSYVIIGRKKGREGKFSIYEFAWKTRSLRDSSGPQLVGEGIIIIGVAILWVVLCLLLFRRWFEW